MKSETPYRAPSSCDCLDCPAWAAAEVALLTHTVPAQQETYRVAIAIFATLLMAGAAVLRPAMARPLLAFAALAHVPYAIWTLRHARAPRTPTAGST